MLDAGGLFQDTRRIGYRRQWEALLAEKGWSIAWHVALKSRVQKVLFALGSGQ